MNPPLLEIHQCIQKLIGLHRQLLDTVRLEREALVEADLKSIQEVTVSKQAVIEAIRQAEAQRVRAATELAVLWRRPLRDLTLSQIIITVQGEDLKYAEQLRSTLNTLTILIERVTEQNEDNRAFVERSLTHIHEMKKNVLGEAQPRAGTYTAQGQKSNSTGPSRLLSKEI